MTIARKYVLSEDESVYHCISRCVRRAFLYGKDLQTGNDFSHRKEWIRNRLIFLIKIFTIDVLASALMDNHQHNLLRTRPDLLAKLSDKDVFLRWNMLYPQFRDANGKIVSPSKEQLEEMLKDKLKIAIIRERLGSISWFMKSLNEYIARAANREDNCKGRFWEGRFKCQRVEGEAAVLACAVYIDLNPIRAKKCETPETSEYTSAYERIQALKEKRSDDSLWLNPITDSETKKGFLSMNVEDYLSILDETGKILRSDKRGAIPEHLEDILSRLGIKSSEWIESSQNLSKSFSYIIAPFKKLTEISQNQKRLWLKGFSFSNQILCDC